jgi:hypothetical protein
VLFFRTMTFPYNLISCGLSDAVKKGQIVRIDKEKYLNSVEYLSVGHPTYFTGLDYIYEDRGEVLQTRFFDHGEYALIAWAGIPTSPTWLPTYMLIKADRLSSVFFYWRNFVRRRIFFTCGLFLAKFGPKKTFLSPKIHPF